MNNCELVQTIENCLLLAASSNGKVIVGFDPKTNVVNFYEKIAGEFTIVNSYSSTDYIPCTAAVSADGLTTALVMFDTETEKYKIEIFKYDLNWQFISPVNRWDKTATIQHKVNDRDTVFARTIAISGDGSTVCASVHNRITHAKAIMVYQYSKDTYRYECVSTFGVVDEGLSSNMSRSLAISNDGKIIALGTDAEDSSTGKVRVYKLIEEINVWLKEKEVSCHVGQGKVAYFGSSVSLTNDGRKILIGAPGTGMNFYSFHDGECYVIDGNNWGEYQPVGNPYVGEDALFGTDVMITGNGRSFCVFTEWLDEKANRYWPCFYLYRLEDEGWVHTVKGVGPDLINTEMQDTVGFINDDGDQVILNANEDSELNIPAKTHIFKV